MSTTPSPFTDLAVPILAGDPVLSDEQRADLHDVFHGSKSPSELVQKLMPLAIPDDTKHRLFEAKQQQMVAMPSVGGPVDKTVAAIQKMKELDPQTLELAEAHPSVLRALTSAANTAEKAPSGDSGGVSASGKGKKASGAEKPAPLALPARQDGLEHLPPIPDKHRRVLASDGGIHDIPEENVAKAFELDPRLHVLNP